MDLNWRVISTYLPVLAGFDEITEASWGTQELKEPDHDGHFGKHQDGSRYFSHCSLRHKHLDDPDKISSAEGWVKLK